MNVDPFVPPEMWRQVVAELDAVERQEGVRILLAIESGSRAWRFPSQDSDFDVRFIYVRPEAAYLSVRPSRDTIERPLDSVLDVNGWDLRKALRLMLSSNAALLEWLCSPIRYRDACAAMVRLHDLARDSCTLPRLAYHYDRLARHGLTATAKEAPRMKDYCYALRPALDGGKLVVAHAGLKEEMHGRGSGAVRSFALYGETTGETDEFGLPVRFNWASEYRGKANVVYGHVPTPSAEWVNRTICVDTGCVFGGKLTALRYPELELVDVPAARVYSEPVRPLAVAAAGRSAQQEADTLLELAEVSGKRTITTALYGHVRIEPENATAALEVMSRFAVDPRWLIYLPPTMSPSETSAREGLLEHPEEALAHFERAGVARVIAEEKRMGSRAVLAVARDREAVLRRFGVPDDRMGRIYTRTGRPFFKDDALEQAVLARVAAAASAARLWDQLGSDWLCLDAELMPWSAKAEGLIAEQYRPVAVASSAATAATVAALRQTVARGIDVGPLLDRMELRAANAAAYAAAVEHYVWPVAGIDDLKLAPFHVLASEGKVHIDRGHDWHMATAAALAAADPALLIATPHRIVALADVEARSDLCDWWTELTGRGSEGLVMKPLA